MDTIDDNTLLRLLKTDFSAGTDEFAEKLLKRALSVLGEGSTGFTLVDDEDDEVESLSDEALEMLAAAGEADTLSSTTEDAPLW